MPVAALVLFALVVVAGRSVDLCDARGAAAGPRSEGWQLRVADESRSGAGGDRVAGRSVVLEAHPPAGVDSHAFVCIDGIWAEWNGQCFTLKRGYATYGVKRAVLEVNHLPWFPLRFAAHCRFECIYDRTYENATLAIIRKIVAAPEAPEPLVRAEAHGDPEIAVWLARALDRHRFKLAAASRIVSTISELRSVDAIMILSRYDMDARIQSVFAVKAGTLLHATEWDAHPLPDDPKSLFARIERSAASLRSRLDGRY